VALLRACQQVFGRKDQDLAVRIELENPDKLPKPGSFTRVLVRAPMQETSVTVSPRRRSTPKEGADRLR
jgi:hypothetical protein